MLVKNKAVFLIFLISFLTQCASYIHSCKQSQQDTSPLSSNHTLSPWFSSARQTIVGSVFQKTWRGLEGYAEGIRWSEGSPRGGSQGYELASNLIFFITSKRARATHVLPIQSIFQIPPLFNLYPFL